MKYEIQKVENIIISDSENVTTNIHFSPARTLGKTNKFEERNPIGFL